MQFTSTIVAALSLLSVASAQGFVKRYDNGTYVTETVLVLTTVCPAATTFAYNNVTYTATASQTVTITNCPCTVVRSTTVAAGGASPTGSSPTTSSSKVAVPTGAAGMLVPSVGAAFAGILAALL